MQIIKLINKSTWKDLILNNLYCPVFNDWGFKSFQRTTETLLVFWLAMPVHMLCPLGGLFWTNVQCKVSFCLVGHFAPLCNVWGFKSFQRTTFLLFVSGRDCAGSGLHAQHVCCALSPRASASIRAKQGNWLSLSY